MWQIDRTGSLRIASVRGRTARLDDVREPAIWVQAEVVDAMLSRDVEGRQRSTRVRGSGGGPGLGAPLQAKTPGQPIGSGRGLHPTDVPALQRAAGNRAVAIALKGQTGESPTRKGRRALQRVYNPVTNTWTGARPTKPLSVRTAMTAANTADPRPHSAHHKEDYAKLRDDILAALAPPGQQRTLENIARFAGIPLPLPAAILTELPNPLPRTAAFGAAVTTFMRTALWAPIDIFAGSVSQERADDPTKTHATKDYHYTLSGHTTPKSELVRDIELKGGFGGVDPVELTNRLTALANMNPSNFDTNEWIAANPPTRISAAGHTINQYIQRNDPQNWAGPQCEIVFPKANEVIQSNTYSLRIAANRLTNNVEVKIQRLGTAGSWAQARQAPDGTWWFDWHNIEPGQYEIMARAWSERGQEWVSRHVPVSR